MEGEADMKPACAGKRDRWKEVERDAQGLRTVEVPIKLAKKEEDTIGHFPQTYAITIRGCSSGELNIALQVFDIQTGSLETFQAPQEEDTVWICPC